MDAIVLPTNVALPTALGAPVTPLQPGQVVQALVLELLQTGATRLQLPQAVIDVKSDVPLTPGATVTLAVKAAGSGPGLRLDILSDGSRPQAPAPNVPPGLAARTVSEAAPFSTAQAPNLNATVAQAAAQTARRPIGEAVVVARTNVPDASAARALTAPAAPDTRPPVAAPLASPEVTPQRALAEAVQVAAARQGGVAPLFADAEQAVTSPALPAPVRAAVVQLLGLRVPLDENLTGSAIKQAFTRSGVLLEPRIAAALEVALSKGSPSAVAPGTSLPRAPAAAAASASLSAPAGAGPAASAPDLKAALLVLRQALKAWVPDVPQATTAFAAPPSAPPIPAPLATPELLAKLESLIKLDSLTRLEVPAKLEALLALPAGGAPPLSPDEAETVARDIAAALQAKVAPQATAGTNPPPPYRGAPLTAQPPVIGVLADDMAPRATAERLIADTDAALSRQTLLQAASIPDAMRRDAPHDNGPRWTFEIPFTTQQGTAMVPFEVARDGHGTAAEARGASWRARFSLDIEPIGPVHAIVTLTGDRVSVSLSAERLSTATQLNDNAPMLGEALRAAELQPNELSFRVGAPRAAAKPAAPGRFMDRAS